MRASRPAHLAGRIPLLHGRRAGGECDAVALLDILHGRAGGQMKLFALYIADIADRLTLSGRCDRLFPFFRLKRDALAV